MGGNLLYTVELDHLDLICSLFVVCEINDSNNIVGQLISLGSESNDEFAVIEVDHALKTGPS